MFPGIAQGFEFGQRLSLGGGVDNRFLIGTHCRVLQVMIYALSLATLRGESVRFKFVFASF